MSFVSGLTPKNPSGVGMYTARLEIGVSVFFLISGFLLYRPFVVAHLAAAPKPRTGAFWLRRLLRIVPAYWLVLFISTSLFHTGVGIGPGGWKAYASHYLFLQIYFPSQDLKGISAAWSLCVEMTFYLFIPLYAALLGRGRARRSEARTFRLELIGLGVLMAISFVWRFTVLQFQDHHSPYFRLATIWLPAYLDLFALGMGLAVVSAWMHHRGRETPWLGDLVVPLGLVGRRAGLLLGRVPHRLPDPARSTSSPTSTWPARPSTACSPSSCCCRRSSAPRDGG